MLTGGRRQDVDVMSDLENQQQAWHLNLGCPNVAQIFEAVSKKTLTVELIK